LFDGIHGGPAQSDGPGHTTEAAAGKNDIGRFNGYIGAGTDGQTDIGLGQGRGIVDTVA
jgi:hypothetical protein